MAVPKVEEDKCTGCGECIDSCPTEAISMKENVAFIDPETCAECGGCVDVCPTGAIVE